MVKFLLVTLLVLTVISAVSLLSGTVSTTITAKGLERKFKILYFVAVLDVAFIAALKLWGPM